MKTQTLSKLALEMESLKEHQRNARHSVFKDAVDVLRKKITRNKKLLARYKKMVSNLESSQDLTATEDEFFSQYLRVDFGYFIDTTSQFEREVFQEFLNQQGTYIQCDFENDCITYSIGPCITINWSPNRNDYFVYDQDSGKEIVSKDEALNEDGEIDEAKTCQLIEGWMNENGYFPSVIAIDSQGQPIGFVNTNTGESHV